MCPLKTCTTCYLQGSLLEYMEEKHWLGNRVTQICLEKTLKTDAVALFCLCFYTIMTHQECHLWNLTMFDNVTIGGIRNSIYETADAKRHYKSRKWNYYSMSPKNCRVFFINYIIYTLVRIISDLSSDHCRWHIWWWYIFKFCTMTSCCKSL